jgi:hypothetical protein
MKRSMSTKWHALATSTRTCQDRARRTRPLEARAIEHAHDGAERVDKAAGEEEQKGAQRQARASGPMATSATQPITR